MQPNGLTERDLQERRDRLAKAEAAAEKLRAA